METEVGLIGDGTGLVNRNERAQHTSLRSLNKETNNITVLFSNKLAYCNVLAESFPVQLRPGKL